MQKNKKKVLIICGGGYFGLVPITFLSYMGDTFDIQGSVDCVQGTSIGGIITVAQMQGCSQKRMLEGFKTQGKAIFTKRWQNRLCILNIPFYDNKALQKQIESFTGDMTIKESREKYPNTQFFVPCTNMTKNKLKVFDNIDGKDDDYTLKSVGLYTSAQVFYFPVLNDNGDQITDGGIRECCPIVSTACGLKNKLGIPFKDMDVFAIGVGNSIDKLDNGAGSYKEVKEWGQIDWITKFLVPDVTNSNISMSVFCGKNMGFNSFTFYNPVQIRGCLDDVSTTDYLLTECSMYKEDFVKKFTEFLKR